MSQTPKIKTTNHEEEIITLDNASPGETITENEKTKNAKDSMNAYFGADRKSYQIRALARKTISYQKRQMFANICCITLCPLLMVVISGILGVVITALINNSSGGSSEYLFCSSEAAYNTTTRQPYDKDSDNLPKRDSKDIPNVPSDVDTVKLTNYYLPPAGDELFSSPGSPQGCVYWFEPDYPTREPYEPKTDDGIVKKDTTFKPAPPKGWFSIESLTKFPVYLATYQTLPYLLVSDADGVDSGEKPNQDPIPFSASTNISSTFQTLTNTNTSSDSLFKTFETNYFVNISRTGNSYTVNSFQPVPLLKKFKLSEEEMDNKLTEKIQDFLSEIVGINKAVLENPDGVSDEEKLNFFIDVAGIVGKMPWGNLLFDAIDPSAKLWNYTMQIGSDKRISKAASYPSQGFRRIASQSQLSNGFLKTAKGDAQSVKITHGFRVMPQLYSSKIKIAAASVIGGILYPFGVSFLLPIFVITLVKEKEERILVMMRMNGLKSFSYYLTHYIHFYSLHIVTTTVFIVTGVLFKMEFFTLTDPGVYILLFFFWGHIQIALALFLTVFFSKSRTALVITFMLVLCGVIISLSTTQIFLDDKAPGYYFLWPPFAFYRALTLINQHSISKSKLPYRMSDLTGSDEVLSAIIAMIVEFVFFMGLTFYLNQIIPSEYGVAKKWNFIFTEPLKAFRNKRKGNTFKDAPATLEAGIPDVDPEETQFEDQDVKAERARVLDNRYPVDSPLVMKRMRKAYNSGKLAVKDVTFAVEKSLIFGLLGPNGAGKTTLISILTGLYPPTSGSASLNKYNINEDMDKVYMSMGVCPQHDILWADLTVEEHLLFYARLKGIPPKAESEAVKIALEQVRLEPFAGRLTKGLSGGEKRRLSIAIALIGNPAVVFLDEPTTGLDPEVRRLIWNIVHDAKAGRTIVLTTHSMEEAEVLCNRIGIMAKGTLRCIGPQLRLKEVYGRGFKLSFSCRPKNVEKATAYIESLLPPTAKKLDSFVTNVSYEFEPEPGLIPRLFSEIEKNKKRNGIDDWGLSQTSLEEVFLQIIGEADAEG
ncbi:10808_t:CDS:2 [Ambispora gerdemannii]|uniref:10808_t:CDS:1 n=1 Tax=Ambispora gerdemannii TaxID=144530 RepID=A0A9N8WTH9_9GLOM|nr:10808_t:CDS:2 [Ambispora gerdemannii]